MADIFLIRDVKECTCVKSFTDIKETNCLLRDYIFIFWCVCVCIYIYIYIYIHTQKNAHTSCDQKVLRFICLVLVFFWFFNYIIGRCPDKYAWILVKSFTDIKETNCQLILLHFRVILTRLGLFYAKRLGNRVHCTFSSHGPIKHG